MKPEKHIYYYVQGDAMTQNQTVNVTIELDRNVKESGEALFRSFGMSFSTGINDLLKQAIHQKKKTLDGEPEPVDFEYSPELEAQDPFFNRATQAELHRRIKNFEAGKCQFQELIEVGEDA
jgi:antitoxin component of RelBE/YafQ-DinJ toxin-antitoxin module